MLIQQKKYIKQKEQLMKLVCMPFVQYVVEIGEQAMQDIYQSIMEKILRLNIMIINSTLLKMILKKDLAILVLLLMLLKKKNALLPYIKNNLNYIKPKMK